MKYRQEIFAVGTWNGFPFNIADLQSMAAAFNELKGNLKVPLKMGHNDEQPLTDGQPALGWVDSLEVDRESSPAKLVAVFTDIPEIVQKAFEKRLYRNVSIELDFDVEYKGKLYPFVVTAVALLGADLPAVNVLNDLGQYLASRSTDALGASYSANKCVSFSVINGSLLEHNMNEIEQLKQKLAQAEAAKADAEAKFAKVEGDAATYKQKAEQLEAETRKGKVDAARANFTKILDDAVTAKTIIPAQREAFKSLLGIDDDDKVLALKESDVKALFTTAMPNGDDKAHAKDDDENEESADHRLVTETRKFMAQNGESSFTKAFFTVAAANPELHADYINQNGEVRQ